MCFYKKYIFNCWTPPPALITSSSLSLTTINSRSLTPEPDNLEGKADDKNGLVAHQGPLGPHWTLSTSCPRPHLRGWTRIWEMWPTCERWKDFLLVSTVSDLRLVSYFNFFLHLTLFHLNPLPSPPPVQVAACPCPIIVNIGLSTNTETYLYNEHRISIHVIYLHIYPARRRRPANLLLVDCRCL